MEARSSTGTDSAANAARGVTKPSLGRGAHRFLSDVIVELGFTDRQTVDAALDQERRNGKRMGRYLVESGALTERQLGLAIAERYQLDYLDLAEFALDVGAANLITQEAAKRYETVPVGFVGDDTLLVAIADPTDGFALNDVSVVTRLEVQPVVAARSEILELIEQLPHSNRSAIVVDLPLAEVQPALGVSAGADSTERSDNDDAAARTQRAIEELKLALLAEADLRGTELQERLAAAEAEVASLRADLEAVRAESVRERNDWVVSHQGLEEELRSTRSELDSARKRHR
jgi:hypothetical protein